MPWTKNNSHERSYIKMNQRKQYKIRRHPKISYTWSLSLPSSSLSTWRTIIIRTDYNNNNNNNNNNNATHIQFHCINFPPTQSYNNSNSSKVIRAGLLLLWYHVTKKGSIYCQLCYNNNATSIYHDEEGSQEQQCYFDVIIILKKKHRKE